VRKDLAGEGLDVGLHTIAWHLAHHHQIQFGRPIGGFQALKHRMADAYVRIEAARSAPVAGLVSALDGDAGLPLDAAVAKTVCSEALQYAAGEMIQLHGGIGITWEHDAHLYFKRAHGSAQIFGQPAEFTDAIAGLAGLR
jgi:alkylation response protein AidB-like acyl-CoA dehydrogenase